MKAINYFFALVVALVFASCTGSEDETFVQNNQSAFESMKSLYGIESASLAQAEADNVPSVTTEEIQSVLEALGKNSNVSKDCKVVDSEGYFGTNGDMAKTISMTAEYQARTRSGAFLENFALCVSLKFNVEKGQVYYIGTDYKSSTDLFNWRANGLSLAPNKDGSYGFNSTSYLYFRVSDEGNLLVRVPVEFNGKYNFATASGTYSFVLSKYSK